MNNIELIERTVHWAVKQGYHPFTMAVSSEEKKEKLFAAVDDVIEMLAALEIVKYAFEDHTIRTSDNASFDWDALFQIIEKVRKDI